MNQQTYQMLDPTAELSPGRRTRRAPPARLEDATIGLLSISKERSNEFLDQVEKRLAERGLKTRRYAKPTNAKVAPTEVIQAVVTEADAVLIGLSD
jgi:hypothetical protein